jgi:hypothetical protein
MAEISRGFCSSFILYRSEGYERECLEFRGRKSRRPKTSSMFGSPSNFFLRRRTPHSRKKNLVVWLDNMPLFCGCQQSVGGRGRTWWCRGGGGGVWWAGTSLLSWSNRESHRLYDGTSRAPVLTPFYSPLSSSFAFVSPLDYGLG